MARVALVTGGMGGLGEAVCIKMHALGYCVVTTYSPSNTKAESWLAQMKEQGFNFRAYPCDVSDFESAQACVAAIQKDIGPVDVLVNNAGITRDMTFKKMDKVNWDAVMRTNLDSVFNMTKPVADGMVERGWGRIINISSVNGQKGAFGQTNYSAAKAGVHGFTKALALEVARKGITVNAVCPGYTDTDILRNSVANVVGKTGRSEADALAEFSSVNPQRRIVQPSEVADAVRWLCGDGAVSVTGQSISVSGGEVT